MDPQSMLQALFTGGATTAAPAPSGQPLDLTQPGFPGGPTQGGPLGKVLAQLSTTPRWQNKFAGTLGNARNIPPAPSRGGAVAQGFMQAMDSAAAAQAQAKKDEADKAAAEAKSAQAKFEQLFKIRQQAETERHNKAQEADAQARTAKGIGGPKADKAETLADVTSKQLKAVQEARKAAGISPQETDEEAAAKSQIVAQALSDAKDAIAAKRLEDSGEADDESTDPNTVGGAMPPEMTAPPAGAAAPMPQARPSDVTTPSAPGEPGFTPPPTTMQKLGAALGGLLPGGSTPAPDAGSAPPIAPPVQQAPVSSPSPAPAPPPAPNVPPPPVQPGPPPQVSAAPVRKPSPAAIVALQSDPSKAAEFDSWYGPGASAAVLGQQPMLGMPQP